MPQRPRQRPTRRGTPEGTHVPVLLRETVKHLAPRPGLRAVDCTVGYGGHAQALLERLQPQGLLLGLDFDGRYLDQTRDRLGRFGPSVRLVRANFADLPQVLAEQSLGPVDLVLADLGVSSMQVDDPARGIGYKHDAFLDMRMDDRLPRTGADLLAAMSGDQLAAALRELADEDDADRIVQFLLAQRQVQPVDRVSQLVRLVLAAKGLTEHTWRKSPKSDYGRFHPAAQTFQALRILVNDELANLRRLLEALPACLAGGGRVCIISFQAGEDRLVERAFQAGLQDGTYAEVSRTPVRPSPRELERNWRSASARMRWARRAEAPPPPGLAGGATMV